MHLVVIVWVCRFRPPVGRNFCWHSSLRFGKLSILFHQSSCLRGENLERKLRVLFVDVIRVLTEMRVCARAVRGFAAVRVGRGC